jgi:sugar lactone lactonase YvrE
MSPRRSPLTRLTDGYGLLEAARWYENSLVLSDMTRGGVYRLWAGASQAGVVVPHRKDIGDLVAHRNDEFVVTGRNVSRQSEEPDAATEVILEASEDEQFFNDLAAEQHGILYLGSVAKQPPDATEVVTCGQLQRIGLDGAITTLADDVLTSNGLGTDPTEADLYHVDSFRHVVWRFDLDDPTTPRESFVDTNEYDWVPDRLAIAADGSVWVAMAGGGVVVGRTLGSVTGQASPFAAVSSTRASER